MKRSAWDALVESDVRAAEAVVAEALGTEVHADVMCMYENGVDKDYGDASTRWGSVSIREGHSYTYDPIPRYLRDISAAWEVVEKFTDGGKKGFGLRYNPTTTWWSAGNLDQTDLVPLDGWTWDDELCVADSTTKERAICTAYLIATGVVEP